MNENQSPQRRPGPHAPLPNASVDAAVGAAISTADADINVVATNRATASSTAPTEEDPRARAARRAQELRDHGSLDVGEDKFFIDPSIVPDGWSYEWRMFEVLGKQDPSYAVNLARKGWEAVPRTRHPEMMPDNYPGNTIVRDGMMLMERPKIITAESSAAEYKKARGQLRAKEEQLGAAPVGQFERDNKGSRLASVKKSYESIPIADK
jgi:hypothetical protein